MRSNRTEGLASVEQAQRRIQVVALVISEEIVLDREFNSAVVQSVIEPVSVRGGAFSGQRGESFICFCLGKGRTGR